MKTCSQCLKQKEFKDFYKDKSQSSGYRPNCKVCTDKKTKSYRKSNRHKDNDYSKSNRNKRKFDLDFRFIHAKAKTKNQGKDWNINFDQFSLLLKNPCYYCNKSLVQETGKGLDRIDNKLGYLITNVLPCCGDCNKIRQHLLTVEEMQIAMKAILEFRKSKS